MEYGGCVTLWSLLNRDGLYSNRKDSGVLGCCAVLAPPVEQFAHARAGPNAGPGGEKVLKIAVEKPQGEGINCFLLAQLWVLPCSTARRGWSVRKP